MTIKVDLLPSEKRGFGLDPVLIVLLIIVVLCVVVFYFISAWLDSDIAAKKDEVKKWDDKITLIKADIPKITKIRDDNNRLRTQIEVIKSLSNDPERYANILYELGSLIPANMWLTNVSVDTAAYSVTVGGTASSYGGAKPLETVAKFMTEVANHSRYFKDATLSSTTSTKVEGQGLGYTFTMDLHYDPTRATKSWTVVNPGNDASGTTTTTTTTTGTIAPSATPASGASTTASPTGSPADASTSSASPGAGSGSPTGSGSESPKAEATSSGSASPATGSSASSSPK